MFLNSKQSVVQNTTRAFIVSMRPEHDPGAVPDLPWQIRYATEAVYIHKLPEREQKMSKGHTLTKKKKIQEILRRTENQFLK